MRRLALVLVALIGSSGLAQSRPESAASRPDRRLSVRRAALPIEGDASVPASCSFSPDGRLLAVARGYDHSELRIVDLTTGAVVYEDRTQKSAANFPPAFDPKSARLVYTVEDGVATLDLVQGKWTPGRNLKLPVKPWIVFPDPRRLAMSTDGARLAIAENGEAYQLDLATGESRKLDCGQGQAVNAFFLDRALAVSCFAERGFETLVFSDGKILERIPDVRILAPSGDGGSWLIAKLDRAAGAKYARDVAPLVEIWDSKTRRARATLRFDPDLKAFQGLCHAAFSSDGSLLVTGDILRIDIRNGSTGAILHTIRHYETNRVVAVALSPDGKRLVTMGRPTEREEAGTRVDGVVLWELAFE